MRCEYYSALNPADFLGFTWSFARLVRDCHHKLVAHHTSRTGELYDPEHDPGEFDDLWDSAEDERDSHRLLSVALESLVMSLDPGPPQVARS